MGLEKFQKTLFLYSFFQIFFKGIGFVKRKLANSIKPVMTISKD